MKHLFGLLVFAVWAAAQSPDPLATFETARKLEREGRSEEAFRQYLAVPGGEWAAVAVARGEAQRFLTLLRQQPGLLESPRALLVEAELLLASGLQEEAKPRYRRLAAAAPPSNWGTTQPGYYPVEPPGRFGSDEHFADYALWQPALPYSYGPGSHRDNWLLRRLIALDLADEGANEFARIWRVHRASLEPFLTRVPKFEPGQPPTQENQLVRPCGFNSYGLQFALDYAFFLKRAGRTNDALAVLLEPLRVMDMDLNPNFTHLEPLPAGAISRYPVRAVPGSRRHGFGPGRVGVARQEFIRLAYGEFKSAGREGALLADLQTQVDRGENRARRVLAQVRLHQGQTEAALGFELDYIRLGGFDPRSAAYRRGLVCDRARKTAEAITAFDEVLAAQPGPVRLPEPEEPISEAPHHQARAWDQLDVPLPGTTVLARGEVLDRLVRLQASLGHTNQVLDLLFDQFGSDESRWRSFDQVEQLHARCATAALAARFQAWARERLPTLSNALSRAHLTWFNGDYAAALTNAAAASEGYYGWQTWKDRFAKLGAEQEKEFMRAVVRAHPGDAVARLELLDLEDRLEGPEAIAALEALLATDASNAFPRGKGVRNRTHFKHYLDLAYRLMRLYERHGRLDELRALGLRLAAGGKPFEKFDPNLYWSLGENGLEEFGNACLALAIQHAADQAYQDQLAATLKEPRWAGARAQLDRRVHGSGFDTAAPGRRGARENPAPLRTEAATWANLPSGLRVVASCETVTTVAHDERFVYAGQPWGLAVYDFTGGPVTRLLLGSEVTTLVATQQQVWVGTPEGLFRIATANWAVAHEPLGHVTALASDDDLLWIGSRDAVMVLNRGTLALRSFSAEEFGLEHLPRFNRFEPDREYVWADGSHGLWRYDRAADAWSAPENPGPREPVHFVGLIDGQVWADVYLDDELRHRPARVDRRTLRLTPVQLGGNVPRHQRMLNERPAYLGKDQGRLVFGATWGRYLFDEATQQIRRLPEPESGVPPTISDPVPEGLLLPDGTTVRSGWPKEADGGLYFLTRAGLARRVSREAWPDALHAGRRASAWADHWPSDAVWAVLFDDARRRAWLGVGAGLAVLPRDGTALRSFDCLEDLCCGPVLEGLELGGKLYFASGWDDARGGLIVFDPRTAVFTSFFRSDGMDSDKVISLAVKEGRLELRYGVEYLRFTHNESERYRQARPGRFDPGTGRFTSGGAPEYLPQAQAEKRSEPTTLGPLPCLGGLAYRRYEHDGQTWLCGSRGLLIFRGPEVPTPTFERLPVGRLPNLAQLLRAEAARVKVPTPISVPRLKELIAHTNRYVRANALAAAMTPVLEHDGAYVPVLAGCVRDPDRRVRSTAVWLLSRSGSAAALAPLRLALEDADPYLRAVAALALAERGEVPDLSFFAEIIRRNDCFGNLPFGADSSVGVEADAVRAYTALAPHADRGIFAFLVQRPPPNHDDIKKLYPVLGASLRKHPDAAEVLLTVQDTERWGPLRGFVQAIFQHAGRELLPTLHRALASQDRVVRSNAARACGALADASSIPLLLRALDMESGLARASIVWALGELKAGAAIPKLVELHQDARNAEHNRRAGTGFLAQQMVAADREEYTALRNLDAIASDWDELKIIALPRPRDPRQDEDLLTPQQILEAVRQIGPAAAQQFYRALAGASQAADRAEAAVGLADGMAGERARNLAILRNLLGDPAADVRLRARVSLLLLAEPGMDTWLRDRLRTGEDRERGDVLGQLGRLPAAQLEFFRPEIQAIATNARAPIYLREQARPVAARLRQGGTP